MPEIIVSLSVDVIKQIVYLKVNDTVVTQVSIASLVGLFTLVKSVPQDKIGEAILQHIATSTKNGNS